MSPNRSGDLAWGDTRLQQGRSGDLAWGDTWLKQGGVRDLVLRCI